MFCLQMHEGMMIMMTENENEKKKTEKGGHDCLFFFHSPT